MSSSQPRSLSLGKQRRLAQIADDGGRFALVAVDQRGNLRRALSPDDPDSVSSAEMSEFKGQVIETIGPHVTGALVDPEFGAAQIIRSGQLPGSCGLIVAVEETGYEADAHDRRTALIPGFDPAKAVRMGASAAKLLLYFHPKAGRAAEQIETVIEVAEQCSKVELPLIVEPLSFSIEPDNPLSSAEKREVVVETAQSLSALDIDMLKLEFPVDSLADDDRTNWAAACRDVTSVSQVPWLLLSAGVGFELFEEQSGIACDAGASGVLAGRAVWREATSSSGAERLQFLTTTAVERMTALRAVVVERARPFNSVFAAPEAVLERWFEKY